jgi:hypothetical protein
MKYVDSWIKYVILRWGSRTNIERDYKSPKLVNTFEQIFEAGYNAGFKEGVETNPEWLPIEKLPQFDYRPFRHIILVEGIAEHSGSTWFRRGHGVADIRKENSPDHYMGYNRNDILKIMKENDIDVITKITHWMPFKITHYPEIQ